MMVLSDIASGKRVTPRELFYITRLCDLPDRFPSQTDINKKLSQEPGQEIVDCSVCESPVHAISGDLNLVERSSLKSKDRCMESSWISNSVRLQIWWKYKNRPRGIYIYTRLKREVVRIVRMIYT
ncbi:hypothetical protein L6164_019414 [Bauhinia variegata]|uniref:Uncharacterized protein n=1 Tax=Bauhinia variegata TaxID=167791 RepID=A0ACB9MRH2_BAUVA|nr:hypothetical protein L6164_019414 [Bauhinia variegata]